jgi:hypothetical protein
MRTTARTAAFIPWASPPLVKTPIRFIKYTSLQQRYLEIESLVENSLKELLLFYLFISQTGYRLSTSGEM